MFNIFPAILSDDGDSFELTNHWLNSWYMMWFFHLIAFFYLHDFEEKTGEPYFWGKEVKEKDDN